MQVTRGPKDERFKRREAQVTRDSRPKRRETRGPKSREEGKPKSRGEKQFTVNSSFSPLPILRSRRVQTEQGGTREAAATFSSLGPCGLEMLFSGTRQSDPSKEASETIQLTGTYRNLGGADEVLKRLRVSLNRRIDRRTLSTKTGLNASILGLARKKTLLFI